MRLTRKEFDRLVERAIASLPEEFARWMEEVPVIVEDRPGDADRGAADQEKDPLGMFVGPDLAEGRNSGDLPPRVMIYREPLMEACRTGEEIAEEIRKTLLHELGHYAGLDEADLERLGYGDMEDDGVEWDIDSDETAEER